MLLRTPRLALSLILVVPLSACTTVKVATTPSDATVEVEGDDISETGEFKVFPGIGSKEILVSKDGYRSRKVKLVRDQMHPALKWGTLATSTACACLSASSACFVAGLFTGRGNPRTHTGFCLGNGGLSVLAPVAFVLGVVTLQNLTALAAPWSMLFAMAGCSLLGSWPLLGMILPAILTVPQDEVNVTLERMEGEEPRPAAPASMQATPEATVEPVPEQKPAGETSPWDVESAPSTSSRKRPGTQRH